MLLCSLCVRFRSQRPRDPGTLASGKPPETNRVRSPSRGWQPSCLAAVDRAARVLPALPAIAFPSRSTGPAAPKLRVANSSADILPSQTRAVPWSEILSFPGCSKARHATAGDSMAAKVAGKLPITPGVYLYKNAEGEVIYVGKAKNLRSRVASYFHEGRWEDAKTGTLVREAVDVDYLVVANNKEALALENHLIKQKKPRFNILLRDDKTYPYIKLTLGERFPRVY